MEENHILTALPSFVDKREVGIDAVFTISSAKPGNGVEQIRDDNLETYWQSDGIAPHYINIHFMTRKKVSNLCLYCDYSLDESYTIKKISVKSGTSTHDLVDITTLEVTEPRGWVNIDLFDPLDKNIPLCTHLIQLRILSMHQNGRDTHIRQLKVLAPRSEITAMAGMSVGKFKTDMSQFALIR